MRQSFGAGIGCGGECGEGGGDGLLLAEVVEGAGVGEGAGGAKLREDGLAEVVEAEAGEGAGGDGGEIVRVRMSLE